MWQMKRFLCLLTLFTTLCAILFFSCTKKDDEVYVNKRVNEFYTYFNQRNFEKMKKISSPRVGVLVDFFGMIGDDLMTIDTAQITQTDIKDNQAKVQVRVKDIFGKMSYHELTLQKKRRWIITNVEGFIPSASPDNITQTSTNENQ